MKGKGERAHRPTAAAGMLARILEGASQSALTMARSEDGHAAAWRPAEARTISRGLRTLYASLTLLPLLRRTSSGARLPQRRGPSQKGKSMQQLVLPPYATG